MYVVECISFFFFGYKNSLCATQLNRRNNRYRISWQQFPYYNAILSTLFLIAGFTLIFTFVACKVSNLEMKQAWGFI